MNTGALRRHAEQWIAAWNAHDLDAILTFYAPSVRFCAPTIVTRWNNPDGTLAGRDALRRHFQRGLELAPQLHFVLVDVLFGVDGMTIFYRRETGSLVADVVTLDDQQQSIEVHVYYGITPP